jgi:hypothetical protein
LNFVGPSDGTTRDVAARLANINLDQKFRVNLAWEGTYYFAVSACNSLGIDGAFSNVPRKTL